MTCQKYIGRFNSHELRNHSLVLWPCCTNSPPHFDAFETRELIHCGHGLLKQGNKLRKSYENKLASQMRGLF